MTHAYFDYCNSHDRRRLDLKAGRHPRHAPIFAALAGHLRHAIARIAARRRPV
ncbi:hypothetical protein [uncultured Mameliella sp.]|uniref:hypothetical protein n=1 Tax=uncultured Mameliella sp. TaxID=1447087 RepID=UPI002620D088|nr:hypothetical protein [uncultured Mameliella sp.]